MGSSQIKGAIPKTDRTLVRRTLLFDVKLVNSVLKSLPAHKNTPTYIGMKELSKKFHQEALTNTLFFAGKALKLEKVILTFTTFSPCPSLPSVATEDRKQF